MEAVQHCPTTQHTMGHVAHITCVLDLCHIHVASKNMIFQHNMIVHVLYLESWYGTVRYGTVRYGTVRYGTVRYGTVQYGTIRYVRPFTPIYVKIHGN